MKIYLVWGKGSWGDPRLTADNGLLGIYLELEPAMVAADKLNGKVHHSGGPAAVMEFDIETQQRKYVYANNHKGTRGPMLKELPGA